MNDHTNSIKQQLLQDYDYSLNHSGVNGDRLASRLADIAKIGLTEEGGSCRIGYSKEENKAKGLIKQWMREAGLIVEEDPAGNVIGRLTGQNDTLPAIMSGSHVDSVPNGGHFDGVLGVLTALEVAEVWRETNYQPLRPFEVVIFSDEEGSRFNSGFTGSKAMMGTHNPEYLASLKDQSGNSFEKVMRMNGKTVRSFLGAERDLREIAAYVEVHIEQGKQLEKVNEPVGVVTGISGLRVLELTFKGKADHAGNTPMTSRKDALVAASEFILNTSSLPRSENSSAVLTVGQLYVYPNGTNVIPGEVKLTVDIRDVFQATINKLVDKVISETKRISTIRPIDVRFRETTNVKPVLVQKDIQELQAQSLNVHRINPFFIPSGAGHDAMVVGRHLPIAMFFVRSKDGISHHPKEWSSLNDCVVAVNVLKDFLEKFTHKPNIV